MKKKGLFPIQFEKQLLAFNQKMNLFDAKTPLYIALSGGVDSMVLLHLLVRIGKFGYSNKLKALHVNHGTRTGQLDEMNLVRNTCKTLGVPLITINLKNMNGSNFEKRARDKRYDFFKGHARDGKLLLGHHIDDSFEWSLMQQFKSANLKASLGIPTTNGNIIRPLMAFSRRQIERYARETNIEFIDDPSNQSNDYERNRMRKHISQLKQEYPSILKNYVESHNHMAHILGLHLIKTSSEFLIRQEAKSMQIFCLGEKINEHDLKEYLRQGVHKLSGTGRGKIREQLNKIVQMVENNKEGPLSLTGGVKVYNNSGHLLITGADISGKNIGKRPLLDRNEFKTFGIDDFKKDLVQRLTSPEENPSYPMWIVLRRTNWVKSPKLDSECSDCVISAGNLLKQWRKKHNLNKKISLQFAQSAPCLESSKDLH